MRAIIWLLPYVVACAVFAGLFWLGALMLSSIYGMSVKDALIALLEA